MHINNLSRELITLIFSFNKPDRSLLFQNMMVCRKWYQVGSVQYYKHITLTKNSVRFLECCKVERLNGMLIGDLVESLTFILPKYTPNDQILSQEQFNILIQKLPHLRLISFNPSVDYLLIMSYMYYFRVRIALFYTSIQEVNISNYSSSHDRYDKENCRKLHNSHYTINCL